MRVVLTQNITIFVLKLLICDRKTLKTMENNNLFKLFKQKGYSADCLFGHYVDRYNGWQRDLTPKHPQRCTHGNATFDTVRRNVSFNEFHPLKLVVSKVETSCSKGGNKTIERSCLKKRKDALEERQRYVNQKSINRSNDKNHENRGVTAQNTSITLILSPLTVYLTHWYTNFYLKGDGMMVNF